MGAWRRLVGIVAAAAAALALVPTAQVAASIGGGLVPDAEDAARAAAQRPPSPQRGPRQAQPEDRFAAAGGCYVLRSLEADGFVHLDGDRVRATAADPSGALAFHFEPTALGQYLLFAPDGRYLGAPAGALADLLGEVTASSPGAMASGLTVGATDEVVDELATGPLGDASGRRARASLEDTASDLTDWSLREDGPGVYRLTLADGPARGVTLAFDDAGDAMLVTPYSRRTAERLSLHLVDGCATFPDVEVNVDGPVAGGATPYGPVRGYLDAHLHGQAFEFLGGRARCGRPWHPYGVEHALVGCPEHEDLGGRTHVLETFLSDRDTVAGHDTTGWPTFVDWPAHFSLTYEQTYHRWIERAWRSGLRMYVNLLVDNAALCELYPFKRNSCNEMDGVRLQAQRMREFEAYIDAQHGGPGHGWLRIVTDPFEARRVMNEGKLAVVLGIEVSALFDCEVTQDLPRCDEDQIDRQLAEMYELGVRQMELVNKFDNALSGVAGDAGETGLVVNTGNFYKTGSWWQMGECQGEHDHEVDKTHPNIPDQSGLPEELTGRDALAGVILDTVGTTGAAPVYAGGPHCNQRGLTDLGVYTLEQMVARGMLFDPDHMSAIARAEAMDLMEELGYSGVVSSHSWSDASIYERILGLGGVVAPMAGSSRGFVNQWEQQKAWADERFAYGIGYGSDINGFATQGGPRGADAPDPVTYPFEGFGGAIIDQQVSGERVYDVNVDGVAHYGLYPDWVEDLRRLAGDAIVEDLERGPEAYLQMWERAVGVPPDSCRSDVPPLTIAEVRQVERGTPAELVLVALGQPASRDDATFAYCLDRGRTALVRFDDEGRVTRIEQRGGTSAATAANRPAAVSAADAARTAALRAADPEEHVDAAATDHGDHRHDRPVMHVDAVTAGSSGEPSRTGPIRVALLLLGLTALTVQRTHRKQRPSPR